MLLVAGLLLSTERSHAQGAVQCPPNIDFENGDFTNWECWLGSCTTGTPTDGVLFASPFVSGPVPRRHTIQGPTSVPQQDFYGGFNVVPDGGGTFAVRVGSDSINRSCERIRYYVHVPAGFNDYSFSYRFAAILNGPKTHPPESQPAFRVAAFDSATGVRIPCADQNYIASPQLVDLYGFQVSPQDADVIYLPWTNGALPIIGQGGKTVVVEVTALDCDAGGHFGYGYFDVVSCGKYKAAVTYCNLDSGVIRFVGTGVTQEYNWYTSKWQFLGKGAYIDVVPPSTPDYFYGVLANGVPGCLDTIVTDTVSDFLLNTVPAKTCVVLGTQIQLEAQASGGVGGFKYSWVKNSELSDPTIFNPIASPKDTTQYFVTVADRRGCFRRDTVQVKEAPDAGVDIPVCPNGDRPAALHVYGPTDVTYNWTDLDGSPAKYLSCTDCMDPISRPEELEVFYTVGYEGCSYRDTVRVFIDTTNNLVTPQDPILVCRPSFIQLQSIISGPNPRLNLSCGTANTITCDPADQDTAMVGYNRIPPRVALNTPFFKDSTFSKYQFIVKKADLFRAGFYSGTIKTMRLRTLNTQLLDATSIGLINISLACVTYDTMPAVPTNTSFETNLTNVATLTNYSLTADGWNQFDFSNAYNWDTTKNLLVDICITRPSTTNTGSINEPIAMVPGNAMQKFSNTINVCGGVAPQANIRRYYQQPVVQFIHCPTPDLPFRFTWRPGAFVSDSTNPNPTVYVQDSMNLAIYSIGRNGCLLYDSIHIFQPKHDVSVLPQDTFICKGQPAFMRAAGGDGYHWYEYDSVSTTFSDASGSLSCTDCATPTATPLQTTTYAVVFDNNIGVSNPNSDNYLIGCPDTLFTTVNVWELPNVRINANDTTIKYSQSVQLFAQGATRYTWTPSGSLSNPNSPAPIATPGETTNYILTGIDSNGCAARDTVTITIDYHNNLLVPTAFTPNGDGRNDEFKVTNMSFQRLIEFRVFNRWGQEVFSTTDMNRGWDGTWKGVAQDMGAYQYLIRVTIPDGNTETYKGDVTLIR